jgi:hypothetical protein
MSFLTGIAGIAAWVILALKSVGGGAIAAVAGGFTPMVIVALSNLKGPRKAKIIHEEKVWERMR